MRSVGIICEYNPFHNGHAYQLKKAKELSSGDVAVCVMSGSLVQRGETAVFDKWARAKSALENGADLVVELPVWHVLQSASVFAEGGIEILQKSALADAVSFGSECANVNRLTKCAALLADEPALLKSTIARLTSDGFSYPMALSVAIEELYPSEAETIKNPNDMLGVSYISAMMKLGFNAEIYPVKRHIAPHNGEITDGVVASSCAVRKMLSNGEDISSLIPNLPSAPTHNIKKLEDFILGFYRTVNPDAISNIPGSESGFENRLISVARSSVDLDEFFNALTSRRYTLSRVKRLVFAGILGLEKNRKCDYVRILGMTDRGACLLKERKDKSQLPFVVKTADFSPSEMSTFKYDTLATDIASLACENPNFRKGGSDFYNSPVII